MKRGAIETIRDMLCQRCPRCRVGTIFHHSIFLGLPKMHGSCSVCHLRYEREPGYFLGAMYISYVLAVPLVALIAVLLWKFSGLNFAKLILWTAVLFLPFVPSITLLARVLWIYLDQTFDPAGRN
jgi:uncharacterized protein (DUF983 family)